MPDLPHVCIIGAGASGLAAAKALQEAGVPFDCFEKGDRVGGLWVFGNSNGRASAYRSLHANTSKSTMAFSDFPMEERVPDFPHHTDFARYLQRYADHFGLHRHIRFGTSVERAERLLAGGWEIETDGGDCRRYDALVVAAGHHWDPRWPDPPFPGHFNGLQMHSAEFVDATPLAGKRVVVLGIGNSAMDIAVEASVTAERVYLSCARGAHIIPHYVFGRPMDSFKDDARIPMPLRRLAAKSVLRVVFGRPERYGMPKPDHRWGETAPTISSFILTRVAQGEVLPRPTIASFDGDRVCFADGSSELADAIVYCTGFRVSFPFFPAGLLTGPVEELPLFKRVFAPQIPNLFFVGLLQVWGAVPPLLEGHANLIAARLAGTYAPPSRQAMLKDIERDSRVRARRYPTDAHRNLMLLDSAEHLLSLKRELRRGRRRAKRKGAPLPITPYTRPVADGLADAPQEAAPERPLSQISPGG